MACSIRPPKLLLFLAAVLVPCTVLVTIGIMAMRQDEELEEKRRRDDRARLAESITQQILVELERVRADASSTRDAIPGVIVSNVAAGKLLLPWEAEEPAERFSRWTHAAPYGQLIRDGEAAEFTRQDFVRARTFYGRAAAQSEHPVQHAYARLLLGRVLIKSRLKTEALQLYRDLLEEPSTVTDEYGVPFAYYAAAFLAQSPEDHERMLERLEGDLALSPAPAPGMLAMIRQIVREMESDGNSAHERVRAIDMLLDEKDAVVDQARRLQTAFPALEFSNSEGGRAGMGWVAFGDPVWFVSNLPGEPEDRLIAVDAQQVIRRLRDGGATGTVNLDSLLVRSKNFEGGIMLGPSLPGAHAAISPLPAGNGSSLPFRRMLYPSILLIVVGFTAFSAYLLWNDMQRELRLARLRSQFVSSVSHELKTPLAAISMFAETLRLRRVRDPNKQDAFLDRIVDESSRLSGMLDNVLDFSRLEKGAAQYHFEQTSLGDVVQDACSTMAPLLKPRDQRLQLDIEPVASMPLDGSAMRRALINLISNAAKFSPVRSMIEVDVRKNHQTVDVSVRDHGIGVPDEERERIFEPYHRIEVAEREHIPGTGLGLSLVKHTVEAHGGSIDIEKADDGGSLFIIRLPLEVS